jgi:membrane dipeptidase
MPEPEMRTPAPHAAAGPAPAAPLFDGHNDLLARLYLAGDHAGTGFFEGRAGGIDLARCRAGGMTGGLFAIWAPGGGGRALQPADPAAARAETLAMARLLGAMAAARPDALRLCRSVAEIAAAEAAGALAAVLHLEGADGVGDDLAEVGLLHGLGLRALAPVWSRPNRFGTGVPLCRSGSPDQGPGLTDAGRRLVRRCAETGILVDVSHLNARGFDDVAALLPGPFAATHSAAHALCPSPRNLTDRQLAVLAERGGLVGLNLAVQALRPDGRADPDTPLDMVLRHLDHLLARLGEAGVAIGSDLDGAPMPAAIGSAAGLPALAAAMRRAGYGAALIARILHGNWIDLLRRTIG